MWIIACCCPVSSGRSRSGGDGVARDRRQQSVPAVQEEDRLRAAPGAKSARRLFSSVSLCVRLTLTFSHIQVIRYSRGGRPLWVSSSHVPAEEEIPPCTCGANRTFEFQVGPGVETPHEISTCIFYVV